LENRHFNQLQLRVLIEKLRIIATNFRNKFLFRTKQKI
jgi:hypothetical protein